LASLPSFFFPPPHLSLGGSSFFLLFFFAELCYGKDYFLLFQGEALPFPRPARLKPLASLLSFLPEKNNFFFSFLFGLRLFGQAFAFPWCGSVISLPFSSCRAGDRRCFLSPHRFRSPAEEKPFSFSPLLSPQGEEKHLYSSFFSSPRGLLPCRFFVQKRIPYPLFFFLSGKRAGKLFLSFLSPLAVIQYVPHLFFSCRTRFLLFPSERQFFPFHPSFRWVS